MSKQSYHHGDLRRALLDAALEAVTKDGPVALSLREIARRADVSHAAPTHHFRNKAGLLTAIAVEGYHLLADELERVRVTGGLVEQGVAYVLFATAHPAHFAVMRVPDLLNSRDPDFVAARDRAWHQWLSGTTMPDGSTDWTAAVATWAMMHGLASLLVEGNVQPEPDGDVETLARAVGRHLAPLKPRAPHRD
ncbi:TetR/AcrR family transcriptional regulator [Streptosporangium sp. NPDC000239]|uniref:TetR/AcrR family transcriptional regulator n=1 Tax=Streptosporangium sp. NPDC000239 TaxID=3154248 RepID=UPI00332CE7FD